ncbi:MAG: hypothetical protein ACXAEU_07405 [Candidatus Hodarchaeales archaeon]|jgi:hypothetical protein
MSTNIPKPAKIDLFNKEVVEQLKNSEKEILTTNIAKPAKILAVSLFTTGIFAAVGSLYTWGDGFLFTAPLGTDLSIFIADLVIAAPASLLAAAGYWRLRRWGVLAGLFVTGTYIYGSISVYVMVLQAGPPYDLTLVIPPVFGIGLSLALIYWTWKNLELFENQ